VFCIVTMSGNVWEWLPQLMIFDSYSIQCHSMDTELQEGFGLVHILCSIFGWRFGIKDAS
jgi:hypothetical protein